MARCGACPPSLPSGFSRNCRTSRGLGGAAWRRSGSSAPRQPIVCGELVVGAVLAASWAGADRQVWPLSTGARVRFVRGLEATLDLSHAARRAPAASSIRAFFRIRASHHVHSQVFDVFTVARGSWSGSTRSSRPRNRAERVRLSGGGTEAWEPLELETDESLRGEPARQHRLNVAGRLKPGYTLEQANAEVATLSGAWAT
jgi:hypothetical protein